MLIDFYRIIDHNELLGEDTVRDKFSVKNIFSVELNTSHPVYKGHFPGNPVVPGVCQVQIIKELVEQVIQKKVILFKSDTIKFLSMIVPEQKKALKIGLEIKEKDQVVWHVTATITSEQQVFTKFKGAFSLV